MSRPNKRTTVIKNLFADKGILFALLLLWLIGIIANRNFRNPQIFLNIAREAAFVGFAGIGMTFLIITGDFDLSVGSLLAFLAIITVSIVGTVGLLPALLIVVLLGGFAGAINGSLSAVMGIPAFIATLAMYFVYRALAFIVSDGNPVQFQEKWFTSLGNGKMLGIPTPFIVFLLFVLLMTFVLRYTLFGRRILAVGNSTKASVISGIPVTRIRLGAFILVGAFTGLAAVFLSSRLWSANPGMKYGYEFEVISAVVLGGTSLKGGKGSVMNTFIASIFFASLNTTMNLFRIDSYMQRVVIGIVLLLAFSMSSIRDRIEEYFRIRRSSGNTTKVGN
ncbi:MAG: ABC transporter permease [Spirochaetales bacterium]|nr:ABC transporter permease [Spirochaetales bacterium]